MFPTLYRQLSVFASLSAAGRGPGALSRNRCWAAAFRAARRAGWLALGLALPLTVAAPALAGWSCMESDYEWTEEHYVGKFSGMLDRKRVGPGPNDWIEIPYRENPIVQFGYAECQVLKGNVNQGMAVLHQIADHYTDVRRVKAAWMIAEYISSGGDVQSNKIDEDNINEAIQAYGRVLFFINLHKPHYPWGGPFMPDPRSTDGGGFIDTGVVDDEGREMIYPRTSYLIPLHYFLKYWYGLDGSHNVHKMISLSYDGDMDLKTYQYYHPYTVDSLNRVVEFANACHAVMVRQHVVLMRYDVEDYEKARENYKIACQILKKYATTLLPLERQRLVLLSTKSCVYDILKCDEYKKNYDEIDAILGQAGDELRAVWKN